MALWILISLSLYVASLCIAIFCWLAGTQLYKFAEIFFFNWKRAGKGLFIAKDVAGSEFLLCAKLII